MCVVKLICTFLKVCQAAFSRLSCSMLYQAGMVSDDKLANLAQNTSSFRWVPRFWTMTHFINDLANNHYFAAGEIAWNANDHMITYDWPDLLKIKAKLFWASCRHCCLLLILNNDVLQVDRHAGDTGCIAPVWRARKVSGLSCWK